MCAWSYRLALAPWPVSGRLAVALRVWTFVSACPPRTHIQLSSSDLREGSPAVELRAGVNQAAPQTASRAPLPSVWGLVLPSCLVLSFRILFISTSVALEKPHLRQLFSENHFLFRCLSLEARDIRYHFQAYLGIKTGQSSWPGAVVKYAISNLKLTPQNKASTHFRP